MDCGNQDQIVPEIQSSPSFVSLLSELPSDSQEYQDVEKLFKSSMNTSEIVMITQPMAVGGTSGIGSGSA